MSFFPFPCNASARWVIKWMTSLHISRWIVFQISTTSPSKSCSSTVRSKISVTPYIMVFEIQVGYGNPVLTLMDSSSDKSCFIVCGWSSKMILGTIFAPVSLTSSIHPRSTSWVPLTVNPTPSPLSWSQTGATRVNLWNHFAMSYLCVQDGMII